MGGSLTLWTGAPAPRRRRPRAASTRRPSRRPPDVMTMLADMLAAGTEVMPGIGSDIADPDSHESAYDGAPLRPLLSLHRRRPRADGRPLRRADDAAAAVHVAPGPRRRAGPERVPRRAPTAAPSTTAGSSAATTWRRWTSTATSINVEAAAFAKQVTGVLTWPLARPASRARRRARLELGPLSLNAYGLMIALGVVAAVWLFGRRLEERNIGTRDDADAHRRVGRRRRRHRRPALPRRHRLGAASRATWWRRLRRSGRAASASPAGCSPASSSACGPASGGASRSAPASTPSRRRLPLAQAIGRWGNYFNQELYGRPTDLPWALEIDAAAPAEQRPVPGRARRSTRRSSTSRCGTSACSALLLWIDKRFRLANGQLLAIYVLGYGIGRFWVEGLRIDEAHHLAGLRWNQWVALAADRRRGAGCCSRSGPPASGSTSRSFLMASLPLSLTLKPYFSFGGTSLSKCF